MNPEVKAKWIAALRSGEYKQTQGHLRVGDAFCCLGVLCNLHAQAHPEIAAEQTSKDGYMGRDSYLPAEVQVWAGLDTSTGELKGGRSLAVMNDRGSSFKTIADAIEEQL